MADRIELKGLKAYGYHGVFDFEKRQGQDFVVDMTCWLDLKLAAETDDLNDTVSYADLAEIAHAVVTGEPFDLIEKVSGVIADQVMETYPQIMAVEVAVHKPQAPIPREFVDVAVIARRSRR